MSLDLFVDVLIDVAKDTLQLVPFLLITYLVMEALEHSTEGRAEAVIRSAGKAGPLAGALLGALPQCGFSAMAGTLYAGRLITAGTLVAVILSTSDELIPVFLARGAQMGTLAWIIGSKVAIGLVVGFAADAVLRALHRTGDGHPHIRELCERAHCHCGVIESAPSGADAATDEAGHHHTHDHGDGQGPRWLQILRCAITHTVQVTLFLFVISLAFGLLIESVGLDVLTGLSSSYPVLATLLSALVGLIPNCAASVAIADLYLDGALSTGPMLAGLLVSGGMGLLVLFRTNNDLRQNLIICAFIYLVGVTCGLLTTLIVP